MARGIEMGHIFQLGRKYAEALDLKVLDENGKQVVVTMGSYGIGVSRAVAAIAEATHDDIGLCWPREIAPADVHVVATGKDDAVFAESERIAAGLQDRGLRVLFDDRRGVSPGVKFKDAELLGMPTIVVVGRGLADGVVEVRDRRTGGTRRRRGRHGSRGHRRPHRCGTAGLTWRRARTPEASGPFAGQCSCELLSSSTRRPCRRCSPGRTSPRRPRSRTLTQPCDAPSYPLAAKSLE
jgi:hypothetical protein